MNDASAEILLVEDSAEDEELSLRALRRGGLANTIHVARDGAEALDYLARRAGPGGGPALVLLDLHLPKLGGLDVLRRLKGDPATREIRVVALISSASDSDLAELGRAGAEGFLEKPVTFERFIEVVRPFGMSWLLVAGRQSAAPAAASRP